MKAVETLARTLTAASRTVNAFCIIAATAFLALMLGLVGLQVVARYGFQSPPQWTEEAARYCMVWTGLLGATVAFHQRQDPVLIEFKAHWSVPRKVLSRLGRALAAIIFVAPMAYFGAEFVGRYSLRQTETLGANAGLIVMIVPVFAFIIILHAAADIADAFLKPDREPKKGMQ